MPARVWCWTPNPVLETKFTEGRRIVSAGGKGHNVARQLRQWGFPVLSVVSKVGKDWLRAARQDGLPIREIPIYSPARTGWALVQGPENRMDFFTEDPKWKTSDWGRSALFLHRNIRKGDWLVVAGSVPTGARQGWWRTLFLGLKKRAVRIAVDGKGQILLEALQAGIGWAKGNLAEVEETMNREGESRCLAAMQKISKGRSSLMVTLGSQGLIFYHEGWPCKVPAPRIRCWDATGSGDVVTAALIYGSHKGWEIGKVVGFAAWAGSENAARRNEVVARLKGRGVFA